MSTKISLYVCCSLAAAAGLGYTAGHLKNGQKSATQEPTAQTSPRISQSGGLQKTIHSEASAHSAIADKQKTGLDALLRRYDKFNPPQIQAELDRLKGSNVYDLSGLSKNPDVRTFATVFYLSYKWGQQAPEQALSYMKSMGNMSGFASFMAMQGWMDSDAAAAITYWRENRKSLGRDQNMLRMAVFAHAKNSAEEAFKWISTLEPKDQKAALPSLVSAIAEKQPEELKALAARLTPEQAAQSGIYRMLAMKWAARDWDYAMECVARQPKQLQTYTMGDALSELAKSDLKKATAELKKLDPGVQFVANILLLPVISEQSPIKAIDWLMKNASEDHMTKLAGMALGDTPQSQSEEVAAYLSKLPEGTARQVFLSALVQKTIETTRSAHIRDYPIDFGRVLSLASQIKDEDDRNKNSQTLLGSWVRTSPAEAGQWVEKSSLPTEMKESIKKQCDDAAKRGQNGTMAPGMRSGGIRPVPVFMQIIRD